MKTRMSVRLCLIVLALMALLCAPAMAKTISPGPDFYYLDNANVLSQALEGEIYFSNKLLCDACGAQIVVVTVDTTGRQAIDEYAYDLFNNWGIGDASKNNGFLLLLAIGDDDYYACTGSGIDRTFSAGTIKDYYDRYLEDDFAAGDYESGVRKFFEAVFERLATTYSADVTTADGIAEYNAYVAANSASDGFGGYSGSRRTGAVNGDYRGYGEEEHSGFGAGLIFVLILIFVLVLVMSKGRRSRRTTVIMPPPPPPRGFGYRPTRTVYHSSYRGAPHIGGSGFSSGAGRSSFGGGSSRSSFGGGSSRSSFGGGSRSSGFGGGSGGGGRSSGGGAGRGRH